MSAPQGDTSQKAQACCNKHKDRAKQLIRTAKGQQQGARG